MRSRPGAGGRFYVGAAFGLLLAVPLWAGIIWAACAIWGGP